ncbi:TonB-dependent receptor [Shewanella sp. WXL01]|uniref:TonB-dependent receptor n=1 Tax=Shewanella sp. WXL01 TaxID=2709721 RepID=UPI0014385F3F|nr:TonB-dependent receptor [Shewanella sp. WXL01]NKF51400.1 TonB-dependent receptor [Shewanella sp. WXL01]
MKKSTRLSPSIAALAVASALGTISMAHAQDATDQAQADEPMEVIAVKGIRSSLSRAQDIKRTSDGVVDAISAEDMGKFPDTNLAESLQRVTGVSIDRKNGEGNQVTVRGFGPSFNLVTLNGRSMPFADSPKQEGAGGTQNRSFNFDQISSESVTGVNIYKTAKADIASGGIGATVDIQTAKPFDYGEFKSAFSVKGNADTSVDKGSSVTPEFSGLVSDVFLDGKLGLLAAYSYSRRDSGQEIIASDGWLRQTAGNCELGFTTSIDNCGGNVIDDSASTNPNGTIWLPQNFNMDFSNHERVRQNAQFVVQFAPNDNIVASLDYFLSDYQNTVERYQTAHWIGNWVQGATDANGTIAKIHNGAGGTDFIGYYDELETLNDSIGFNLDWQLSDNLKANFDYHHSVSHAQPDGNLSEKSILLTNADFFCATSDQCYAGQFTLDYSQGTQLPILNDPAQMAEHGFDGLIHHLYDAHGTPYEGLNPYDPRVVRGNLVIGRGNEVENTIDQYQLDFEWVNDSDDALASIKFGAGYVDFQYDTTWRMNFTGIAGYTPNADDLTLVERGDVGSAFSGHQSLFSHFYQWDVAKMYSELEQAGFSFNPEVYNKVNEATTSAYVQFNFQSDFNGMPLNVVTGVRYEQTDVTGTTNQVTPYALRYVSLTELRSQFDDVPVYGETTIDGDYAYFLPNLDASIEVYDDVIARFSAGRSLTRNDLTALRPAVSLANSRPNGPYLAYQGNANLKPYVSDNLDLSLEWYYAPGSYASIGYFKKWVDNYIANETTSGPLYNADGVAYTDPSQGDLAAAGCNANGEDVPACDGTNVPNSPIIDWQITTPVNRESAEVDGFEIAVQHLFDDTGFGVQANFTYVNGDIEYDIYKTERQTALTGLSDSANLVAFYENYGFQARLAYNWRDKFLSSTDQLRAPDEPIFTEEYGQLDANVSYDINDNFTVFVEGLNLTDESLRMHGRFENQLVSAQSFGPRFSFGVRGSF